MDFDAFVSYSSKDKAAADSACAILESHGIRCWVAPRDIRPGEEYGAAIVAAIERCRVMVLIFSSSANGSNQIQREIERAVSKGIPIVPVRIEEVAPTRSMEYFLGSIHWLDALTPPFEKHLHHLAETVKPMLSGGVPEHGGPGARRLDTANPRTWSGQADTASSYSSPMPLPGGSAKVTRRSQVGWLVPALGGAILALLAVAGMWLYSTRPPLSETVRPSASTAVPSTPPAKAETVIPENVPFISDRDRTTVRDVYLSAPDHKALAISPTRIGFISGQRDDDVAKGVALESCQRNTDAVAPGQKCELYALGNTIVYTQGRPPVPPEPWLIRNAEVERPFDAKLIPLVSENLRGQIAKGYPASGNYAKALAISSRGAAGYYRGQSSREEAIRRALEACGKFAGFPCMVVAVDDSFVVPIPTTGKVTGFFQAASHTALAPEMRSEVARRLGNATSGWNSVAIGSGGRPGLGLGAASEQASTENALADCSNRDHNCRVVAIGPFSVSMK